MTCVAIYCRVSTEKQELEQQLAACRRFCTFKGFENVQEFAEIGSGKDFKRPEFQRLLSLARKGELQGIVVFRIDRLGRNSREVLLLFDEFERRGVQLYSVNENLDSSSAIGRAMRDILIILAQLEREQIAEATRHRLQALKNLGKKLGRHEKEFDLEKAKVLRAQGWSWRRIAMSVKAPSTTVRLRFKRAGIPLGKPARSSIQDKQGVQPLPIVAQESETHG